MRRYAQVSGAFFVVIAAAHLVRAVMGWPIQIADLAVPVYGSVGAFVVTFALAIWAFRSATSVA